ncbi:MAG: hypothetical protein HUJ94_02160, partial [Bacteroidales bacterium]|nr:hypothetical protein [Bacteroidales bacterium]
KFLNGFSGIFHAFQQFQSGHKSVSTTMIYLHVAKVEKGKGVYLIDTIFS